MSAPAQKTGSEPCRNRTGGPFVSIVTPVYNGERHIRECIESVLKQTYTNWEYLVADNCSRDATAAIVAEYASRDSRIRLVQHSECLPIMPNWNRAMRLISPDSQFCKVVHADDTLMPDCIEAMVEVAMKNDRIGIVGAYRLSGDQVSLDGLPPPDEVFSGREVCRRCLMGAPDIFGSPSNTMIRSGIVRSRACFYDENDYHADTTLCFEILKEYDFGYVHRALTHTRVHKESETSRNKILNTLQAAKYCRMVKYGPWFLSTEEYPARLKAVKTHYYQVLVSRYILKLAVRRERGSRKAFCDYHKKILQDLGERLEFQWVCIAVRALICKKMRSFFKRG